MLVRFLKNWTLPMAMLSGTLGYFILANVPFLAPTKPYISDLIAYITPLLIFAQLLPVSYTHLTLPTIRLV